MNFKKFAIPALLSTGLLLAACSTDTEDKEPVEETLVTETTTDETVTEETPAVPETDETEVVEEDPNNETAATNIFLTYFDGINEEDVEKIESVYEDSASTNAFKELFATYDIKTSIESYEVISQLENEWAFDVQVKFVDESGTGEYNDNLSGYEIKVNTETGKITYLEITGTQDI